jgi:hypothetical protein
LQSQTQETSKAGKIKTTVQKRATGETSRVKVKLVNGTAALINDLYM